MKIGALPQKNMKKMMPTLGRKTPFGWLSFLSPFQYRNIYKKRSIRLLLCSDWWLRKKATEYVIGARTQRLIEVRIAGLELAWSIWR